MSEFRSIADIRREYGELTLQEGVVAADPLVQFNDWFTEVLANEKNDPTAMVLATVDEHGHPDTRVVLLKGIDEGQFVFYTNYESAKAEQLAHNTHAALNFFWPQMARQVRIRGTVSKVSAERSDLYFSSRPLKSQYSATISLQSRVVASRSVLEQSLTELLNQHQEKALSRPEYWGGYQLKPSEIEFWQGRDNRLHDRIHYAVHNGNWQIRRLAP